MRVVIHNHHRRKLQSKDAYGVKTQWMAKFEDLVVQSMPEARGRIDWDSATHMFNTGLSLQEAAKKYVATRRAQGR